MCLYAFFWDIVVMMIYNSRDGLLAKFISREYSLARIHLSHCVYPWNQRSDDMFISSHCLLHHQSVKFNWFINLIIQEKLFKKKQLIACI